MVKIVINTCFGGFGLSKKAYERLIELGMTTTKYNKKGNYENPNTDIVINEEDSLSGHPYYFVHGWKRELRTDPRLIRVVEELGKKANGECAKLAIVEIPDGVEWEIDEYDGNETIAEKHRTWR